MFVTFAHVLSNVEFVCLGDVGIWDGGLVSKGVGEIVV